MGRTRKAIFATLGFATLSVGACGGQVHQTVGGHEFSVPREHVLGRGPFWLPPPEKDSLLFVTDPQSRPQDQHTVVIETRQHACNGDAASQMVQIACGRQPSAVAVTPPFERTSTAAGGAVWIKKASPSPSAPRREIASCFEMSAQPNKGGLCLVVTSYEDLVLSTYMREAELQQLPDQLERLRRQLRAWEVR